MQLMLASLIVPEILIRAYEQSDDETYFVAARDYLLARSRFELRVWLPRGLLLNDHTLAARTLVLVRFWGM